MGVFEKLFGRRGLAKPPWWARGFGDDGERFDRFAARVAKVLADAGYPVDRRNLRTGSLMLEGEGSTREWIGHEAAARCAAAAEADWERIIRVDCFGIPEGPPERPYHPPPTPASIGTAEWGGVLLVCGTDKVVIVLLPIRYGAPLARLPPLPPGSVAAIVVCNGNDDGELGASTVARAAQLERVYAINPGRTVDRGRLLAEPVLVDAMPEPLQVGELRLWRRGASVLIQWDDGTKALVGDAVPLSLIAEESPHALLGMVVLDHFDFDVARLLGFMTGSPHIVLMGNVPGLDVRRLAEAFSQLGLTTCIANGSPGSAAAERRQQVLMHIVHGELERAEAVIAEGIAAGEGIDDLRYHGAMITLLRGNEAAALAALQDLATPEALNSRALLYARRRDARAIADARAALASSPRDPIVIRGAVFAHVMLGDEDGARAVLAAHGAVLDPKQRAIWTTAIEDRTRIDGRGHEFPELAKLALDVVQPMLEERRFAEAEPFLRRAVIWNPEDSGLVGELGYALSQLGRDADAIAVYDERMARGSFPESLDHKTLLFLRGDCYLRVGRVAEAADDFQVCVTWNPNWHEARVRLGIALLTKGDRQGAIEQLNQLIQQGAPSVHVRTLLDKLDDSPSQPA